MRQSSKGAPEFESPCKRVGDAENRKRRRPFGDDDVLKKVREHEVTHGNRMHRRREDGEKEELRRDKRGPTLARGWE